MKPENSRKNNITARPFVKWAGGKTQLLETFEKYFPRELKEGKIKKYFEPFVGSGAVFFHIKKHYGGIEKFYLSDINPELILVYRVIQKEVKKLIRYLNKFSKEYLAGSEEKRKDYYYRLRMDFNEKKTSLDSEKITQKTIRRAAEFIFLNRTCFNGLFRVNRNGDFNVPIGSYKNPRIVDEENLYSVSIALKGVHISCRSYGEIKRLICKNSFIYFDPPYRPLNHTSNFTSYSKYDFDDKSQIELGKFFGYLNKKEAKIMLSNSDPHNTDKKDDFFDSLYKGFNINRIQANRIINSNSDKRGKINELLITNY